MAGKLARSSLDGMSNPLSDTPLTRREAGLAALGLAVLALALYLPHVVRGGWYLDDWILVATMSEAGGGLDVFSAVQSYREVYVIALGMFYVLAGEGQASYLAIGVFLTAFQAWLFFLVLRRLGLHPVVAATAVVLFLVLPVIDATRLWMAAFPIQVGASIYLIGVLAAIHGLTRPGYRAVGWHALAVCLYFASMLTYEAVIGLVAVTWVLYAAKGGLRAAMARTLPDLAAIGLALAIIAPGAADEREAKLSLSFLWDRANQIFEGAEEVFRWLLPASDLLGGPVGLLLLGAGLVGGGIAIARGAAEAAGFRAWAKIAALACAFTLAGLLMLLPADAYFVPRVSGLGNRTGAFAAYGMVLLLIAAIAIGVGGVGSLLRRPRLGAGLAIAFLAFTGGSLAIREIRQQDAWAESWRQQEEILAAVDRAAGPALGTGAAVITFNHTTFLYPADVSVFAYSWDLRGALWLAYDRPDVAARPWGEGTVCGPEGVVFADGTTTPSGSEPYGYESLVFIDVGEKSATSIGSRRACEAGVRELESRLPGALSY